MKVHGNRFKSLWLADSGETDLVKTVPVNLPHINNFIYLPVSPSLF